MSDIEQRLRELNTWSRGGQRAPHKPLLVLWALARLQRGEPRMASWLEIEPALSQLLVDFGPPRLSTHPEHPFWRLQKDSVWEVTGPAGGKLDVRENASGSVAWWCRARFRLPPRRTR